MASLVFAVTWQRNTEPIGARLAELVGAFADAAGVHVVPRVALSYSELARLMRERLADVAWLPPIAFLKLSEAGTVVPIVSHIRGANASYESVLLVRRDATAARVEDLRGKTAGWVDPWSAAGYVLPRVELLRRGTDPRAMFGEERFYGSHDAAVRALLDGKVDAAATFAQLRESGEVLRGGFSNIAGALEAVRVIDRFGPIPCDVIAAHEGVPAETRDAVAAALVQVANDPRWKDALARVFGVEEFRPGVPASYDALRALFAEGTSAGLFKG